MNFYKKQGRVIRLNLVLLGILGFCSGVYCTSRAAAGTLTFSIAVSVNVEATCFFKAPFNPKGAVSVRCTQDIPYSISRRYGSVANAATASMGSATSGEVMLSRALVGASDGNVGFIVDTVTY